MESEEPDPRSGTRRVTFCTQSGREAALLTDHEYEIVYRIEGVHRYDRKARMGFIGTNTSGQLLFSARGPDRSTKDQYAGTQTYESRWIKSVRQVARDPEKRYVERRA